MKLLLLESRLTKLIRLITKHVATILLPRTMYTTLRSGELLWCCATRILLWLDVWILLVLCWWQHIFSCSALCCTKNVHLLRERCCVLAFADMHEHHNVRTLVVVASGIMRCAFSVYDCSVDLSWSSMQNSKYDSDRPGNGNRYCICKVKKRLITTLPMSCNGKRICSWRIHRRTWVSATAQCVTYMRGCSCLCIALRTWCTNPLRKCQHLHSIPPKKLRSIKYVL